LINQARRAGALNAVLMSILCVGLVITAIPLGIGSFIAGLYAIPRATPDYLMYAWDALVLAFLFFWGIGLITELQRSEPLTLSKFLHLPVSVNSAFLINYISSLLRLSLVMFGPPMLGFALALIYVQGLSQWAAPILLAAFFLMVTGLTYQLQGWLAALMSNPRKRRGVIVGLTAAFVLLAQLPNLLNFFAPWRPVAVDERPELAATRAALRADFDAHKIRRPEYQKQLNELNAQVQNERAKVIQNRMNQATEIARLANGILPIGWLPFGVFSAAQGRAIPAILGILGMAAIGGFSLVRSYRTTIGLYQGAPTNRIAPDGPAVRQTVATPPSGALFLETRLPAIAEPVAAVALAAAKSMLRSPEAKMMLLTPVIMIPIFGSMIVRNRGLIPEIMRPLVAIGAMVVVLFGLLPLMGNLFGIDRDGFRVFVLSPAPRRQILMGKNLALVPLALIMAAILLVVVQIVCPMRIDHLLAMLPQYISMYLMFCIMSNFLSIYAPFHVAAGSLKASNPKLTIVLTQLLMFMLIFPLTQAAMVLPLGIEALWRHLGYRASIPVYLLLSLVVCAIVVVLYRVTITGQGNLLQARERKILENVTNRAV
jgi:hypothetical protein